MNTATEQLDEPEANPYNSKKAWHTEDAAHSGSAEELYREDKPTKATRKSAAPEADGAPGGSTNYKKRYDDLKKHYDHKISEFKQREAQLTAVATDTQPAYAPPKTADELESFKSEYPDLYETVESVAHLQSEQQMQVLKTKMSVLEERELNIQRKEAESTLRERHPDFEDIRGDDKFHEWAKEQPEEIQIWIYENPDNVNLAIKAIDLYKMERGIKTRTKQPQSKSQSSESSAADLVSTRTTRVDPAQPKIWTQREIASLSIQQYDKFEQEIDLAIMEGRVR